MHTVGILAIQGDVEEHARHLENCGARSIYVKDESSLDKIDGLIIPGGESTTIAKFDSQSRTGIFDAIKRRIRAGLPVYGTCMGAIALAGEIEGSKQGRIGVMDIKVRRNAFGPQKHSFECSLIIPDIGTAPVDAVFIRAPLILSAGPGVKIMARLPEGIVMARQKNMLVTAFHPEITDDLRIHRYFLDMIRSDSSVKPATSPLQLKV